MAGGGLGGERFRYKQAKRVAIKAMDFDIKNWADGMIGISKRTSFYFLATKFISARLIKLSAEILHDAVKRCPYETGALRASGEVQLIAGKATGMDVAAKTTADGSGNFEIIIITPSVSKAAGTIELSISFDRQVKGMDLAFWTHEELLHYVKRPKAESHVGQWHATKFRTGPKYLENAFKLRKAEVPREVQRGLNQAVREYNKKHKTRARKRRG